MGFSAGVDGAGKLVTSILQDGKLIAVVFFLFFGATQFMLAIRSREAHAASRF